MGLQWDIPEIAELVRLVNLGLTAREISLAMGKTRSSVLGICHRRNIILARAQGTTAGDRSKNRQKSGPKKRAPMTVPLPPDETELCQPVTLEELEPHHCHWPVNDGSPFLYCAMPVVRGGYCARHTRAKQPVNNKPQENVA